MYKEGIVMRLTSQTRITTTTQTSGGGNVLGGIED